MPPQTPLVKCKCSYFHFHTKMRKPWFFYWRKIWSIIFIVNLLSLTLLIFRLIITCFGIVRINQIASFFYKNNSGSMPPDPHSTSVKPIVTGLPKRLVSNSFFWGGIWGEAELILGILFGEHRRNTFRELRNLFINSGRSMHYF